MKRAIVIGCPGGGKSTFSRKLRDTFGLPLFYLDMIWHKPDKTTVSREEFDERLAEILEGERWVIDGNYSRTLEMRLRKCDTVFLFDIPTEDCLAGAASRIGKKREELPWLETEFDSEFREHILSFREKSLPAVYALLEKYRDGRDIIVFKSRAEADEYVKMHGWK